VLVDNHESLKITSAFKNIGLNILNRKHFNTSKITDVGKILNTSLTFSTNHVD
jgi:hypothetical protein